LIFFCGNFAELFEGGFKVFDPSTQDTAWSYALARGRPERNESKDDDFLGENVGVGEVVGFFEAFISQPEDIEAGFVAIDIQFNFSGKNPNRELFL